MVSQTLAGCLFPRFCRDRLILCFTSCLLEVESHSSLASPRRGKPGQQTKATTSGWIQASGIVYCPLLPKVRLRDLDGREFNWWASRTVRVGLRCGGCKLASSDPPSLFVAPLAFLSSPCCSWYTPRWYAAVTTEGSMSSTSAQSLAADWSIHGTKAGSP